MEATNEAARNNKQLKPKRLFNATKGALNADVAGR